MSAAYDSDTAGRLEAALLQSEARRQALLDSALDCILCADRHASITDFNAAAERTFRLTREQALGNDLCDTILPANVRKRYRRDWFGAAEDANLNLIGSRFETRAMRADGSEFPAEITVTSTVIDDQPRYTIYIRNITARKHAEETMIRLAAIVESSQDAIFGVEFDGRIASWNRGAEHIYGFTSEEAIGAQVSLIVPSDRKHELSPLVEQLKGGKRIENFETVRVAKDGRRIDVSMTLSPILDADGAITSASVIARDITARKLAEEALRKANETSVYKSPVPIIAADVSGNVTMWNQAAEAVFGWSEQEVIGKSNPIIPADAAEEAETLHSRILSGETITGVEVRRQKRDGSSVAISLSGTPLWDAHQRVRGIIGFLTNITERKRAEEALRTAEQNYRGIVENAIEGIYQTTPDGRYLSANPALARMLGFHSPEELVTSRSSIAEQEYVRPELYVEFRRRMEEKGVVQKFEYEAYRKDGKTIWVSENAHVVRDAYGDVSCFEGTVEDITQQRELEQQLRQMQKIEGIGRLAGGVAHDFNNILMAISSYSDLLLRKLQGEDPCRRYVEEVVKATERGASLTQGLLAFSRKQVLSPKVLDLNALISDQLGMLKRLINECIDFKFKPGLNLGAICADPGQVQQVVMNLVINARDAMPSGGELVIATDNTLRPGPQTAVTESDYVQLSVCDNGCGMDAETKSHIFEPFFTTKEQGKGTGLGLATVFGIVQQSSGHILLESEPGQGTTFKIYLPRVDAAAADQDPNVETQVNVRGHETILLVEDEDSVREPAAEYLRENGYRVLKASRGAEALEIAQKHTKAIHLLLTDVVMPQMSGRELADRVAAIHPETRIVFMSGYSTDLHANQEPLDPSRVLLQKPFRLVTLGQRIREYLDDKGTAAAAR